MRFVSSLNYLRCAILSRPVFHRFREMSHLPKVFVKHLDAEEKLKIYFAYGEKERNYIFMRPKEEILETTITRMKLKMVEVMSKKFYKKKKKVSKEETNENQNEISVLISLFKNGELVSGQVKNVDAWTENTLLNVNDSIYEVSVNPPTVLSISLPNNIMAGFPVYPKLELEYCSKEECSFTWYRSISKSDKSDLSSLDIHKIKNENWVHLSEYDSFFYMTREPDTGSYLRVSCIPKCGEKIGLEEATVSVKPVEAGPPRCPFEDRHEFTKELTGPGK